MAAMNLPQRARKASGLDIEAFAALVGVSWRQLQQWEQGKGEVPPPFKTILRLFEARPRECVDVLDKLEKARAGLRKRVVDQVQALGRGPKKTVSLDQLRKALCYREGPMGREPIPNVDQDEVTTALRALEESQHIVLEPAADADKLSKDLGEAAVRDPKRGYLVYARPGPAAAAGGSAGAGTRIAKRPT
jgi:transcriptional regulator with XRE-family HTH domain